MTNNLGAMRHLRNNLTSVLLAAVLFVSVGWPARGETFFPEIQTLRARSFLALTLSDRENRFRNESPTLSRSVQKTFRQRVQANVRLGPVGIGGLTSRSDFREETDTYVLEENREVGAGYLAGVLDDLFTRDDRFVLVLGQSATHTEYVYNTYRRDEHVDTLGRAGFLYRWSAVLVGYAHGNLHIRLAVDDPPRTPIRESYRPDASIFVGGLIFEGRDHLLRMIYERMDIPAAAGNTVNLDTSWADHAEATMEFHSLLMSANRTQFTFSYQPEAYSETEQTEVALGFRFSDTFTLSATQSRIRSEVGLVLLGIPVINHSDSQSTLLTLQWQF